MAQFSDYDVHRQPGSSHQLRDPHHPDALPLYAADPYSDHPHVSQPPTSTIASNSENFAANTHPPFPNDGPTGSSDPRDFYNQYRQSFRSREPGGVYGLDSGSHDESAERMTTIIGQPRVSHFETKANGLPATSVTVRLNNLAKKASQERVGKREPSGASGIPRGRQTSLKALVNKFEQSPDEILPVPGSRSASRSASTHTSPATTFNARSFRTRTPSTTPSEDKSRAERRVSGADRPPFDGNGLNVRKRTAHRSSQELRAPHFGSDRRFSAQSTNSSIGSQSINLTPRPPQIREGHVPLFGEIVAGEADHGWGIPQPRPRRGSEGSVRRPTSLFRDDTELDLSLPSAEAWYSGQGSLLDEMDFSRLQPRSGHLQHQRSRSDLSGMNSTTFKPLTNGPEPLSRSRAGSTTPTRSSRQSRLPVRSKASSRTGSESGQAQIRPGLFYDSQAARNNQTSAAIINQATSSGHGDKRTESVTPRKSPRRVPVGGVHPTSPRVGAYISDTNIIEPAKSPPLRSSRNRQNMAQASTSASRGKIVERASTVGLGATVPNSKDSKTLPELKHVDLATRRERIQRAFSKSVEEKEAQQRRSLILEAHRRKREELEIPPVPSIDQQHFESSQKTLGPRRDSDAHEADSTLRVDTGKASLLPASLRRGSADDSPTLGALNLLPAHDTGPSSPSDTDRRSSFASSGTFMDDEPQDSPALQRELHGELSTHPNADGVHIVLGGPEDQGDSRWSSSTTDEDPEHSNRVSSDPIGIRLPSIPERQKPEHTHQLSSSTNRTSIPDQPLWSPPVDLSKSTSTSSVTELTHDSLDNSVADSWKFSGSGLATAEGHFPPGETTVSQNERRSGPYLDPPMQRGSLSPAAAQSTNEKYAQRASLVNPADFAAASPSINDWIAHQAEDTPVEEQSKQSFRDPVPQNAPSKPTGLRRPGSRPLTPKTASSPQLPEIQKAGSDWGIVKSESPLGDANPEPSHLTGTPAPSRNVSHQGAMPAISAPTTNDQPQISPRRGLISKYNPKADFETPTERTVMRPSSARSIARLEGPEHHSASEPPKALSEEEQKQRDAEQKRLTRRKNILKELVDTESSFGQDMTVVVDIYKETSHVILQNPEDVKTLFGNAAEIVQFSMLFLDALKLAANTVYKLPRSKRWRSKRDSSATADSSNGDESSSIVNMELTEDERDRMTSVGQCFTQHMSRMEDIYTDYLKNHEQASSKLVQLQKSDKVQIWLTECRSYAHDLTTAWDLDSLLVKPVQRILKYPLLLRELVEVTPENHPDFLLLDNASREIVGLSQRINSAKKRADLVSKTIEKPSKDKKKTEESRNVFSKTFGRNKEKFRNQVGLSEVIQDKTYNLLADKFGSHFFQVQVVMRDVEVYTTDVQKWVENFDAFVSGIEQFIEVSPTSYPEVESRWRMFRNSVREIQGTALTDHLVAVKKHVIDPMETLLKLYDGPQKMMEKRKKRVLDHARWKASKDGGAKLDKKIVEQGEQFVALNDTLKDELPKLFASTKALVEACLNNFVQLQLQWQIIWRRKLSGAIDMRNPHKAVKDIVDSFTGDFKFTEQAMLNLGICNGSLLADDANSFSIGHNSSATTLSGDASSSRQTSLTYDDAREARMLVNEPAASRNRAASANGQSIYAHNMPYNPAAYAQGPSPRSRANSSASGRGREPQTWPTNGSHLQVTSPQGTGPAPGRPSSQSQRTNGSGYGQNPYDPSSYMRYSEDSTRSSHWYHGFHGLTGSSRQSEGQYGIGAGLAGASGAAAAAANPRASGVFSSALPPSDTPPHSAPLDASRYSQHSSIDHSQEADSTSSRVESQYNVLFLAASVYEFNIDRARREAGYPYLTYAAGEIFDVIGEKGELWLAKNQDDPSNTLGWIWNKHFAKLATES